MFESMEMLITLDCCLHAAAIIMLLYVLMKMDMIRDDVKEIKRWM